MQKAKGQGIKLISNFDGFNESFTLIQDKDRIQQVLFILIQNAIKFTLHGQVTISTSIQDDFDSVISLSETYDRQWLCVSVKDTGIGISHQDQKKLFKLCSFVEKPNDSHHKGIGLGLMISENVVNSLGGQIWCTSQQGIGTEFVFKIKLCRQTEEELCRIYS